MDKIVGIEIKGWHRHVDLKSSLIVFLDVEMFLLGLTLGRHADRPLTKRGLVRQGVVQADGTKVGLRMAWKEWEWSNDDDDANSPWLLHYYTCLESQRRTTNPRGSIMYTSTASSNARNSVLIGIVLNLTIIARRMGIKIISQI